MTRYYGKVGYGISEEIRPGVFVDKIIERPYYGTVERNQARYSDPEKVTRDVAVSNAISIVADPYANSHFFAIRYITWQGALWDVNSVEVKSPRLVLQIGGLYNGPVPEETPGTP